MPTYPDLERSAAEAAKRRELMGVRVRRAYGPAEDADGDRVLVARLSSLPARSCVAGSVTPRRASGSSVAGFGENSRRGGNSSRSCGCGRQQGL